MDGVSHGIVTYGGQLGGGGCVQPYAQVAGVVTTASLTPKSSFDYSKGQ